MEGQRTQPNMAPVVTARGTGLNRWRGGTCGGDTTVAVGCPVIQLFQPPSFKHGFHAGQFQQRRVEVEVQGCAAGVPATSNRSSDWLGNVVLPVCFAPWNRTARCVEGRSIQCWNYFAAERVRWANRQPDPCATKG